MKRIGLLLIILASFPYAWAGWLETTAHPGNFCVPCHQRFSLDAPRTVTNREVLHIYPCSKTTCHESAVEGRRYRIHMSICVNCHPKKNETFDIHEVHLNMGILAPPWNLTYPNGSAELREKAVDCRLCHAMQEGYNSSVVSVPGFEEGYIILARDGAPKIAVANWSGDCGFCHPSVRGAGRLHDVHWPVILQACPVCHTSKIFKRSDLVKRVSGFEIPEEREAGIRVRVETSVANISQGGGYEGEGFTFSLLGEVARVFTRIAELIEEMVAKGV